MLCFLLCLSFLSHPPLPHLPSQCAFPYFDCHFPHLFPVRAPLSSWLPPHLFLLPAACHSYLFTCSLEQFSQLPPSHSPRVCSPPTPPQPLPSLWPGLSPWLCWAQTNLSDRPPCIEGGGWSWQQEYSCHLTPPASGCFGIESPTHPKATHPIGLPRSSYPLHSS